MNLTHVKTAIFTEKKGCILPAEGYKCFKCFNRKDNKLVYYKEV